MPDITISLLSGKHLWARREYSRVTWSMFMTIWSLHTRKLWVSGLPQMAGTQNFLSRYNTPVSTRLGK